MLDFPYSTVPKVRQSVYHEAIDFFCATADKSEVRCIMRNVADAHGSLFSAAMFSDSGKELTVNLTIITYSFLRWSRLLGAAD